MSQPIRVELPPGCQGIDTPDRRHGYDGKRGESALVDAAYARQLRSAGLSLLPSKAIGLSGVPQHSTKECPCGRLNFADNDRCPVCGADISNVEVDQ